MHPKVLVTSGVNKLHITIPYCTVCKNSHILYGRKTDEKFEITIGNRLGRKFLNPGIRKFSKS